MVGKAVYQAHPDYVWDLDVNVVEIKIKATGNTRWYAPFAGATKPVQQGGAGSALIKSSGAAQAMTAEIIVEAVNGPTRDAIVRGRKFMELGLSHQAIFNAKNGHYDNTAPKQRIRSSLQDNLVHWDVAAAGTIPWTFVNANHHLNITTDGQAVADKKFDTFDNPILLATNQFVLAGDQVDVLNLRMAHQVYLIVHTKQDINGSAAKYTQRAKLNWNVDATGTIDGAGAYTPTGAGITGDAAFAIVTDGSEIPSAAGNINEAFAGEAWTQENQ